MKIKAQVKHEWRCTKPRYKTEEKEIRNGVYLTVFVSNWFWNGKSTLLVLNRYNSATTSCVCLNGSD